MAQKQFAYDQVRDRKGALVIPLDQIRTFDSVTGVITSGVSGTIYAIGSGKEAYIRQISITELSGHDGFVQFRDTLGSGLTPPINVMEDATTVFDTCIGPVTSGINVEGHTAGKNKVAAEVTLTVQIDPGAVE